MSGLGSPCEVILSSRIGSSGSQFLAEEDMNILFVFSMLPVLLGVTPSTAVLSDVVSLSPTTVVSVEALCAPELYSSSTSCVFHPQWYVRYYNGTCSNAPASWVGWISFMCHNWDDRYWGGSAHWEALNGRWYAKYYRNHGSCWLTVVAEKSSSPSRR